MDCSYCYLQEYLAHNPALKVFSNVDDLLTEAERLLKAYKKDYRIGVVYVDHLSRVQGKASGATWDKMIKAFWDMIKFRFTQWR